MSEIFKEHGVEMETVSDEPPKCARDQEEAEGRLRTDCRRSLRAAGSSGDDPRPMGDAVRGQLQADLREEAFVRKHRAAVSDRAPMSTPNPPVTLPRISPTGRIITNPGPPLQWLGPGLRKALSERPGNRCGCGGDLSVDGTSLRCHRCGTVYSHVQTVFCPPVKNRVLLSWIRPLTRDSKHRWEIGSIVRRAPTSSLMRHERTKTRWVKRKVLRCSCCGQSFILEPRWTSRQSPRPAWKHFRYDVPGMLKDCRTEVVRQVLSL